VPGQGDHNDGHEFDRQLAVISPEREKVEGEADHEQRDREMDQDNVLSVFRQKRSL
jgi:hypothetical protein